MTSQDELELSVFGGREAHRRLVATMEGLQDEAARRPSRLPGWTVGHVLTHIARNADSHVRMLRGAMEGEHLEQYAGGNQQRAADIEAGAGRPAAALAEDVVRSAAALDETWAAMSGEAWEGYGMSGGRHWPCREMPLQRWREVEVHHADLDLGYGIHDWPDEYVTSEFKNLRSGDATRQLLAWMMGRAEPPDASHLRPWTSRP